MQIKTFIIPVNAPENIEKQVNSFLSSNRVLEVVHEFVDNGANSHWCLLIKFLTNSYNREHSYSSSEKIDYKTVLDEVSFNRFCILQG